MVEILKFPQRIRKLLELVDKTRKEIMIVTPFYEKDEIDEILRRLPKNVKLRAVVRANTDSDIEALKSLNKRGNVRAILNLHAKILIFDKSTAMVSSLNLDSSWEKGSLDVGVLLRGKVCRKLVALVNGWWKEAGQVSQRGINHLSEEAKKRTAAQLRPIEKPRFSLGKRARVQGFSPRKFEERHLILNINWNPHGYKKGCSLEEAKKNTCCHERRRCVKENWVKDGGCASAYLFKDFEYATSKSAIKKGRLVFFIAKNPDIKNEYYFAGFLYMKSNRRGREAWGSRLFYFKGDKKKSMVFPSAGNKVIRLNKKLKKKMGSLRGNPKYISKHDAIAILKECYRRTKSARLKKILDKDFGERI